MGSASIAQKRQPVRASIAAFAGTTIEWYDFFIYSTAAALVFPQLFFPNSDPNVGLLISLATFGVGFFARPIGGFVFGHLGDRIGRKSALITTLLMMGLSTAAIGMLPTYSQIGVWAPVLLVVLRIIQGISVGGEWGGAVLMAGEHAPESKRTWYASFAQLGSPAAVLSLDGHIRTRYKFFGRQFRCLGLANPISDQLGASCDRFGHPSRA